MAGQSLLPDQSEPCFAGYSFREREFLLDSLSVTLNAKGIKVINLRVNTYTMKSNSSKIVVKFLFQNL